MVRFPPEICVSTPQRQRIFADESQDRGDRILKQNGSNRSRMRPLGSRTSPLWERILANNAEAEFIVAGRRKTREGGTSY